MALSRDCVQQLLIDSSYRDRAQFPYPSSFDVTIKGPVTYYSDPVGIGFPIYADTGSSTGYTGGTPGYLSLSTGIPITYFEDRMLGQYVEVINRSTLAVKGYSTVLGFTSGGPPTTGIYTSTPISNTASGDGIFIRQIKQAPANRFLSSGPLATGTTSITIPSGSVSTGSYLANIAGMSNLQPQVYRITNVTGSTATISPGLKSNANTNDIIEIYNTQDNEFGLTAPGGISNRTSAVNHEIKLEWLRFPRHPLFVNEVVTGSISLPITVSNYSYLIVEFKNRNEGSSNVIQSNNNNIKRAQFIVPVEDNSTNIGQFYTLRSSAVITMKYNPSEPIHFSVYLPNGLPIRFDPNDELGSTLSLPNPDMQISALFSIKRVLT